MAQSERNTKSKNRSGEYQIDNQVLIYTKKAYRKPSEQLLPNRQPLSGEVDL